MTTIDGTTMTTPENEATADGFGADARSIARTLTLTGASGALAGLVVGGIGGRLAMFVLRLTSEEVVVGMKSDDGFTIGRISSETIFLLAVSLLLGMLGGLAYAVAREALPQAWRIPAWTVVCTTLGGAAILHDHGVDFHLLDPVLLACAVFIAIPGLGGFLTAWLVERRDAWWFAKPWRTVIACVALLPMLAAFPVLVVIVVAAAIVLALGQIDPLRSAVARWGAWPVRGALVVVVALSSLALVNDLRAIV